jgi:hypothetical protein
MHGSVFQHRPQAFCLHYGVREQLIEMHEDSRRRLPRAKFMSIEAQDPRGEAVAGFAINMPLSCPIDPGCSTSSQHVPPSGPEIVPGRRYIRSGLVAFCIGSILVGAVARGEDRPSGTLDGGAAVQADQGIEALLRQIEQQITIGHTMAPEGDNAMVTWHGLLEVVSPPSPAAQRALADFATYARRRATEEQAAGRPVVASDLMVFAEQAIELLPYRGTAPVPLSAALAPAAPAATVQDPASSNVLADLTIGNVRSAETPYSPKQSTVISERSPNGLDRAQAPMPPAGSVELAATDKEIARAQAPMPAAGGTLALATVGNEIAPTLTPMPPLSTNSGSGPVALATSPKETITTAPASMAAVSEPPAPHSETMTPTPQEQAAAEAFARRGDAMLAIKDIQAARSFYEHAANSGSMRAALALAQTYDPTFLGQWGVIGPKPNPEMAATWYRKAAALGYRGANARLRTLEAAAAK